MNLRCIWFADSEPRRSGKFTTFYQSKSFCNSISGRFNYTLYSYQFGELCLFSCVVFKGE